MDDKKNGEQQAPGFVLIPLGLAQQIRAYLGNKPLPYDEVRAMIGGLEQARPVAVNNTEAEE